MYRSGLATLVERMPDPTPSSAVVPEDQGDAYNIEVVCRSQSADAEPVGDTTSNDPVAPPALGKGRHKHRALANKAKVHPTTTEKTGKGRGLEKTSAVHVTASGDLLSSERRSSSVFDMLEHQRQRHRAPWKLKVGAFLDGIPFTIISIIFTIMVGKNL